MYYYQFKLSLPLRVERCYVFLCFKKGLLMVYIYNCMANTIDKYTLLLSSLICNNLDTLCVISRKLTVSENGTELKFIFDIAQRGDQISFKVQG